MDRTVTRLTLVFGTRGLTPGGEYLTDHRCGCAPGYADPWAGIPAEEYTTGETGRSFVLMINWILVGVYILLAAFVTWAGGRW